MKQENLELIKKDFSARIPYGVKFMTWKEGYGESGINLSIGDAVGIVDDMIVTKNGSYDIRKCRAYLRKLSSMTEEEREEVNNLIKDNRPNPYGKINNKGMDNLFSSVAVTSSILIDWLNAHHFDYRGLIEKYLAVELTEENLSV